MQMISRDYAARAVGVFVGAVALGVISMSFAAELEFNKISACKDNTSVFSMLKQPITNCTAALGFIERTIRDIAKGSEIKLCFMESPPIASLSGFRCIHSSFQQGVAIACYRPVSLGLLAEYRANYTTQYSGRVATYLEDSKRCPGSNGDASRIIETTFPPIFMSVAEHAFGFGVQYGDTKPGSSTVSHGFARTSPEVAKRGSEALEYVVFGAGLSTGRAERVPHGNWRLHVDSSPEFASQFVKTLRQHGLDTFLASIDIDIQRAPRASQIAKQTSLTAALSEIIANKLNDEGFKEMGDDDLKLQTGKPREEIAETISKGTVFGARNLMTRRLSLLRILTKTTGLTCTRGGRGAIGAYLVAIDGEKEVQADFGSVGAMILGIGSCASSANSSREYLRNIAEESKQTVLDELSRR